MDKLNLIGENDLYNIKLKDCIIRDISDLNVIMPINNISNELKIFHLQQLAEKYGKIFFGRCLMIPLQNMIKQDIFNMFPKINQEQPIKIDNMMHIINHKSSLGYIIGIIKKIYDGVSINLKHSYDIMNNGTIYVNGHVALNEELLLLRDESKERFNTLNNCIEKYQQKFVGKLSKIEKMGFKKMLNLLNRIHNLITSNKKIRTEKRLNVVCQDENYDTSWHTSFCKCDDQLSNEFITFINTHENKFKNEINLKLNYVFDTESVTIEKLSDEFVTFINNNRDKFKDVINHLQLKYVFGPESVMIGKLSDEFVTLINNKNKFNDVINTKLGYVSGPESVIIGKLLSDFVTFINNNKDKFNNIISLKLKYVLPRLVIVEKLFVDYVNEKINDIDANIKFEELHEILLTYYMIPLFINSYLAKYEQGSRYPDKKMKVIITDNYLINNIDNIYNIMRSIFESQCSFDSIYSYIYLNNLLMPDSMMNEHTHITDTILRNYVKNDQTFNITH